MTPLIPLESFRKTINYHPFHFWGLANSTIPATCDDSSSTLVFEYAWQGDDAGRDDIRQAIETAEARLLEHLGFRIAPQYVSETLRFPRYHDTALNNVRYAGADGRWITMQLPEGKVRAAGVEARTLIATVTTNPGGGIVLTDEDSDGFKDTFTITIVTSVTDPEQIAVYVGAPYRLDGEGIGERWRVAPVTVSISGGVATIKGRYWMLVKPILYQVYNLAAINPTVDSNFIGTLDVVRRYTDPTGTTVDTAQAKLIWETPPYPSWATACGGNGASFGDADTDPAAVAQAIARVGIRDPENGIVSLGEAVYDATAGTWGAVNMSFCRPPDRVTVRYLAGDGLENGNVQQKWVTLVSRFAAAELARPICACSSAQRDLFAWQNDRAFAGEGVDRWTLSLEDLGNPFGTRAGQIAAWRAVKSLRQFQAILA